ncbi:MAG: hypothetical protein Q4F05_01835 [bacterium]|nr:hypothetical protein [bacterium]
MLHTFMTMQFIMLAIATNVFIYRLQHIPLIGKKIKNRWYKNTALKSVFSVYAIIRKIVLQFVSKGIYLLIMIMVPVIAIENITTDGGEFSGQQWLACIVYIFTILNLLYGAFLRPTIANAEQKDFIMLRQMHVEPKGYYLVNMLVKIVGESIVFLVLLPFIGFSEHAIGLLFIAQLVIMLAMMRFVGEAVTLWIFERKSYIWFMKYKKIYIAIMVIILPATYCSCYYLKQAPEIVQYVGSPITFLIVLILGICSVFYMMKYNGYKKLAAYNVKYSSIVEQDMIKEEIKDAEIGIHNEDIKHEDIHTKKYDHLKGYEYLHAIFFDRHKRLVRKKWRLKMIIISAVSVIGAIAMLFFGHTQEIKELVDKMETFMPALLFLAYCMCSGEKICKALFYHCDVSLLKYGYYHEPQTILSNFKIRLHYLIKLDIQPMLLLCTGISLNLLAARQPMMIISMLPMFLTLLIVTAFFDIYQLFLYYVFQPYLENYETKSIGYVICSTLMYLLCYGTLQLKVVSIVFTIVVAVVTVIWAAVSFALIYKLAPRRFKLK